MSNERPYLPLVDIMDGGVFDDITLSEVTEEFRRRVVTATLDAAPTNAAAARSLGMSREGLYRLRKRYGLEVAKAKPRPIPKDWRRKLDQAQ